MSGLRTILVPFNNTQPNAAAVDAAKRIAEAEGAYIEGAYSRQVFRLLRGKALLCPGTISPPSKKRADGRQHSRARLSESLIAEQGIPLSSLDGEGLRAGWTEMMGTGPEGLGEYARAFGISVLHRDLASGDMDWKSTAEALLFESGRPLLLVSDQIPQTIGRRILVAWNGSTETARALGAARPLLARSEAIQVLSVEGHGFRAGRGIDHFTSSGQRIQGPI